MSHHRIRQVPALDGLRGAAVAGVLLYHGDALKGGYLGVDLFFVLSGYLITSILLTEWRNDRAVSLSNFWARRARRLFPALIAVLIGVALYARFFATSLELHGIRMDGLATLFYVANWHTIVTGGSYFGNTLAERAPLKHMWSLAIEEQFYVVWPIVVVLLLRWKNSFRTIFRLAVGLAIASVFMMVGWFLTGSASKTALYEGTFTRAAAILFGAALAAWQIRFGHTRSDRSRTALEASAMVAMLFLGFAWCTAGAQGDFIYSGGLALCGLAVTVVIAAATHPEQIVVARVLSWAPLRGLGLISYGMYIWSVPIYVLLTPERTGAHGWTLLGLKLVVSLAVAILSYILLEQPIRRGALKPTVARFAVPAAATAAIVALVLGTVGGTSLQPAQASTAGYAPAGTANATKLLVVGDSVPELIADQGITPLRKELGVSVVNRTLPGCVLLRALGPVKGIEGNVRDEVHPCKEGWRGAVDQFKPDVVLMMFGQFPNDAVQIDGQYRYPCDAVYQEKETEQLTQAVQDLSSGGAHVVLVTAPGSTVSWVVDRVKPGMNKRVQCLNDVYKQVAAAQPNAEVVDFAPYICPSADECKDRIDGIDLREDTIHFRDQAARLVSRWIVPKALQAARQGG